ncbi:MAG: PD-(D/E)XK nuclease family protein [bacterium]
MNFERNNNIWISHSAISDFETCPRLYYYRNVYRNSNNRRVQIVNPYLTLGSVVHKTIEGVGRLPEEEKKLVSLSKLFEENWQRYSGRRGGFSTPGDEESFKDRGIEMIKKAEASEVLKNENYKLADELLKVRLFKGENLILVGAIDWIEILEGGEFHIIDFKTGRSPEKKNSLQLPIYLILVQYNFIQPVKKTSYWYLEKKETLSPFELDPAAEYVPLIKEKAQKIKEAIVNDAFDCQSGNGKCFKCKDYEAVINGQAEYLGVDLETDKDLYFLPWK